MKRKLVKLLQIVFMAILILMIGTTVLADYTPGDLDGSLTFGESQKIRDVGNQIIGIIQAIGTVVAVVVLIILGIKYMLGSVDEKAEYKKSMLPYVIGAASLFAASTISYAIMHAINF